ncbi:MAG: type IV pilus modification PilV family protein [Candidatus Rifleibacteriota bacterium]
MNKKSELKAKIGFTLVELLVTVSVMSLVILSVTKFVSWVNSSQQVTAWKQNAMDRQRLNEIFWQKYFSAATHKIVSLNTDAKGVLITPPDVATSSLYIVSSGSGNLLSGYTGAGGDYTLWKFTIHKKDAAANTYTETNVKAFVRGSVQRLELWAELTRDGNTVLKQKLLENLEAINASKREYKQESMSVLELEFILSYPHKRSLKVKKTTSFRIPTEIQDL